MARRSDGLKTKQRILSACAQLFIEHGYRKTTMAQIYELAGVSASSFQNLFGSKDGVLMEFVKTMYESQFAIASATTDSAERAWEVDEKLSLVYAYAAETAIQIAITDLNENVRECYLEAYTYEKSLDYIQHATAAKLFGAFGQYQPDLTEEDFYVLDFGSAGIMRGYMANPANAQFTTERKARAFIMQVFRSYKVPEDEVQRVLAFVEGLDLKATALQVMDQLFHQLALRYDFPLAAS